MESTDIAFRHLKERLALMLIRHSLDELEFVWIDNWNNGDPTWLGITKTGLIKPTLDEMSESVTPEYGKALYGKVMNEISDSVMKDFSILVAPGFAMRVRIIRKGTVYPMLFELKFETYDGLKTDIAHEVVLRGG